MRVFVTATLVLLVQATQARRQTKRVATTRTTFVWDLCPLQVPRLGHQASNHFPQPIGNVPKRHMIRKTHERLYQAAESQYHIRDGCVGVPLWRQAKPHLQMKMAASNHSIRKCTARLCLGGHVCHDNWATEVVVTLAISETSSHREPARRRT